MTAIFIDRAHMLYDFVTKKKIYLCTIVFKNILKQFDQRKANRIALPSSCLIYEYILAYKDLSLPSDSWFKQLDTMVMPKFLPFGDVPSSPTHSVLAPPAPGRSTRYNAPKKSSLPLILF